MMNKKKKEFSGSNRRKFRRLNPDDLPILKNVTLNQGIEAQVIDISNGGILLTSESRLRPQIRVILKIITKKGVFKLSGIVVRSSIISLDKAPVYQSAISFDVPLSIIDEHENTTGTQFNNPPIESNKPDIFEDAAAARQSVVSCEDASNDIQKILTIHVPDGFEDSLGQDFKLNAW
ncbi:MAG TPA: PilZ domain-containing protein [Acidobacteriota bacterium]|nr:PilZ domain-containing protein [Acidobacteriota bacterium]